MQPFSRRPTGYVCGLTPDERAHYDQVFGLGFRELYLEDIERANAGDVRMGTFIMCAAFLDALSLAYSAGLKIPNGKAGKWARFMERYLGAPYEPIWFTSSADQAHTHLQRHPGYVILHRESFVRDVVKAFEAFAFDVWNDDELRARVFEHVEEHPPMGLAIIVDRTTGEII